MDLSNSGSQVAQHFCRSAIKDGQFFLVAPADEFLNVGLTESLNLAVAIDSISHPVYYVPTPEHQMRKRLSGAFGVVAIDELISPSFFPAAIEAEAVAETVQSG